MIKSQSTGFERAGTMTVKSSLAAKRKRATMRQDGADTILRSSIKNKTASRPAIKRVLVVDIGGTSIKILATGQTEVRSFPSRPRLTPARMVSGVKKLAADWTYDVMSIGYPGAVLGGRPVAEPHNLGRDERSSARKIRRYGSASRWCYCAKAG
jgi:polyphosphate glucokinase